MENQGKPPFNQISNCLTYWNAQENPVSTVTELINPLQQVYFINMRLFSKIFCKDIDQNTAFSVRSGPNWNYCVGN